MNDNFLTLEFENGLSVEAEILGRFDFNNKEYIALFNNDNEEVYLYIYKDIDKDNFKLLDILDDNEYLDALDEFNRLLDE